MEYILITGHTLEILITCSEYCSVSPGPLFKTGLYSSCWEITVAHLPSHCPGTRGTVELVFSLMVFSWCNWLGSLAWICDQRDIKTPQGNSFRAEFFWSQDSLYNYWWFNLGTKNICVNKNPQSFHLDVSWIPLLSCTFLVALK